MSRRTMSTKCFLAMGIRTTFIPPSSPTPTEQIQPTPTQPKPTQPKPTSNSSHQQVKFVLNVNGPISSYVTRHALGSVNVNVTAYLSRLRHQGDRLTRNNIETRAKPLAVHVMADPSHLSPETYNTRCPSAHSTTLRPATM